MTAIPDLSALVDRLTGGNGGAPEHVFVHKLARIGGVAVPVFVVGNLGSLWRNDGIPGSPAAPGAAAVCTRATSGALPLTNPAAGKQKWLLGCEAFSSVIGGMLLYDRLVHSGGLDGTIATAQAVNTPALTRYSGAAAKGNMAFLEIYSQLGATSRSASISYTNQDGTAGRTGTVPAIGGTGNRDVSQARMMALQSGDTGVRSVESVTLSGTTGTAGNFGVTIGRPLVVLPVAIGAPAVRDLVSGLPAMPELKEDACLALLWTAGDTTAPALTVGVHMVEN